MDSPMIYRLTRSYVDAMRPYNNVVVLLVDNGDGKDILASSIQDEAPFVTLAACMLIIDQGNEMTAAAVALLRKRWDSLTPEEQAVYLPQEDNLGL